MSPELKERLTNLARWHECRALDCGSGAVSSMHGEFAADIRAAIVSADDQTKNMLILRAHKAKDRRFTGESITGFDELMEQS